MKKIVIAVVAAVLAAAAAELTRRLMRRDDLALTGGVPAEEPEQTVDLTDADPDRPQDLPTDLVFEAEPA